METNIETIVEVKRIDLSILKNQIKELVAEQKILRNQRKTVNLIGERKMEPWQAASIHNSNRIKLSGMYVAYGVLRGKDFEEQINIHVSKKDPNIEGWIRKNAEWIVAKYAQEVK
jgi:hypothetical protein